MTHQLPYGQHTLEVNCPDDALVYQARFPAPAADPAERVLEALAAPLGANSLMDVVKARRAGAVVVVVSDITRPVPYRAFLARMLAQIEAAGVSRNEVLVLIATGMHRPSTAAERLEMFGAEVVRDYRIVDHRADCDAELVELPGVSWSGNRVRLNRLFVNAGCRIVTGLVEPHFMVGFSGGRKAVCPGLVSLDTIRRFHGYEFIAHGSTRSALLEGNPCHEEALSVARQAGVDFALNVVMNHKRQVVRAFAGELEQAHAAACAFAHACCCPRVETEADVLLTSCGGHPLDTTFYQCVKGFVSPLPAVKQGGVIICAGGCSEGIGSEEYRGILQRYAGRWREFLQDIQQPGVFTKDQWELQIHTRALLKTGQEDLHFVTSGVPQPLLDTLNVRGHAVEPQHAAATVQRLLDEAARSGARVAVIPEGPYCAPVAG